MLLSVQVKMSVLFCFIERFRIWVSGLGQLLDPSSRPGLSTPHRAQMESKFTKHCSSLLYLYLYLSPLTTHFLLLHPLPHSLVVHWLSSQSLWYLYGDQNSCPLDQLLDQAQRAWAERSSLRPVVLPSTTVAEERTPEGRVEGPDCHAPEPDRSLGC